jgi:hypothetical protein
MAEMRALSASEISDLQAGLFSGILLLGYYEKGDTPVPITYFISSTLQNDDGGSVIEVGSIKLEHIFVGDFSFKYFGNFNSFILSHYKNNHTVIIDGEIDLLSGTLVVPDGCILKFENGRFKNGILTNCKEIIADNKAYIFENILVDGLAIVYAEWFGLDENSLDNTQYLRNAIKSPNKSYPSHRVINIGEGNFKFSGSVDVSSCMIIGSYPSQKLNGRATNDYKTTFFYEGNDVFLYTKVDTGMLFNHTTLYIKNISVAGSGAGTGSTGLDVTDDASVDIVDCEFRNFHYGLRLSILISSKFINTDISQNHIAIYFHKNLKSISTTTIFSSCYIFDNDYHFKNDASAVLNCNFDNCIFESSRIQSFLIDPTPTTIIDDPSDGIDVDRNIFTSISFVNCYSENNNSTPDRKTADIEILPYDNVQNFRLSSVNCMWFGSNNSQNYSDFIKISSGAWFSSGDTFGRYKSIMEINDEAIVDGKINISFNSMVVDRFMNLISPISVISEETRKYLYINAFSFEKKRLESIQPLINISLSENEYPDNGISVDRNIEKSINAVVLKTKNNGFARIDDNNVFSFGMKRKMGNTINAISLPVNDTHIMIEKSSSEQGFIRFIRNKPGGSSRLVADFCLDYSANGNETSDWWKSTTLLMVESLHDLPETPLPDIMYYKYGDEKFYFINAFTGKLVDGNGYPPAKSKGTTAQRPSPSLEFEGFEYYDKDLKKKILCNGITWVNVNGTPL